MCVCVCLSTHIMKLVHSNIHFSHPPNFLSSPVNERSVRNPEKLICERGWRFKLSKVNVCVCLSTPCLMKAMCGLTLWGQESLLCRNATCHPCPPILCSCCRCVFRCWWLSFRTQIRNMVKLADKLTGYKQDLLGHILLETVTFPVQKRLSITLPSLTQQFVIKKKIKITGGVWFMAAPLQWD